MIVNIGIQPSEIPRLTIPRFIAIITGGKSGREQNLTYPQVLAYTRAYQAELRAKGK